MIELKPLYNEITIKGDPLPSIKGKLADLDVGDMVTIEEDGKTYTGKIKGGKDFNEERGTAFMIISVDGKYFSKHISVFIDWKSKINNKTSKKFFTIKKIIK